MQSERLGPATAHTCRAHGISLLVRRSPKHDCRACPPGSCWSILGRIKHEQHNILASPNSVKLFTAWAAKHKEVIAIEDRWNLAVQQDPATAEPVRLELERVREEAQRMLAQAQTLFHEELRARGIRE